MSNLPSPAPLSPSWPPPSAPFPIWMDAADPSGGAPVSLAELGSWAATLSAIALWAQDAQKVQLGTREAELESQLPLLDTALAELDIQLQLAGEGLPTAADGITAAVAGLNSSGSGSGSSCGGLPAGAADGWEQLCGVLYAVGFGRWHKLARLRAREEGGGMQLLAPAGAALRLLLAAGPELRAGRRAEACISALMMASMPRFVWGIDETIAAHALPRELPAAAGLLMQMAPDIAAAVRLCSQGPADSSNANVAAALFYGQSALELLCYGERSLSADGLVGWCHAGERGVLLGSDACTEWAVSCEVGPTAQPAGQGIGMHCGVASKTQPGLPV